MHRQSAWPFINPFPQNRHGEEQQQRQLLEPVSLKYVAATSEKHVIVITEIYSINEPLNLFLFGNLSTTVYKGHSFLKTSIKKKSPLDSPPRRQRGEPSHYKPVLMQSTSVDASECRLAALIIGTRERRRARAMCHRRARERKRRGKRLGNRLVTCACQQWKRISRVTWKYDRSFRERRSTHP